MKDIKRSAALVILVVCFAILGDLPRTEAQDKARPIVLKGALLIDGTGRPPIENSVLIIDGHKIRAAGKMGSITIPKDAKVQNVAGKTIMPALINLHGHLGLTTNGADSVNGTYTEANVRWQLNKYLSYGVGTVASLGQDGRSHL